MRAIYKFGEDVCQQNPKGRRAAIIIKCQNDTIRIAKVIVILICLGLVFFVFYPLYMFFFEGEFVLILNIIVPGVDHQTLMGYLITNMVIGIYSLYGLTGNIAFDWYMLICICNYTMFIELLNESFERLGEMWKNNEGTEQDRIHVFRNIILAFTDIDKYFCI